MLERFVEVDYRTTLSLVAETGLDELKRSIALATYVQTNEGRAEMALVVDDAYQGLGLGSVLIEHLGEAAAEAGISTFEAEVLSVPSSPPWASSVSTDGGNSRWGATSEEVTRSMNGRRGRAQPDL